jgi:hypothetical protein
MQARTHRDVAYFDRAVAQLKEHFVMLQRKAKVAPTQSNRRKAR